MPTTCLVLKYNFLILLNSWLCCIRWVLPVDVQCFWLPLKGRKHNIHSLVPLTSPPHSRRLSFLGKGDFCYSHCACEFKTECFIDFPFSYSVFAPPFVTSPLPLLWASKALWLPSELPLFFHSLTCCRFFVSVFTLSQSLPTCHISLSLPHSQSPALAQFPPLVYFYTLSHLSP